MKLLLVRHAIAVPREEFPGQDLDRPLTDKGKKRARRAFQGLARVYPDVEAIYTSPAVRAVHTAKILARMYEGVSVTETQLLAPGCLEFDRLLALTAEKPAETIALVGHEPDMTDLASHLLGMDRLPFELSKAGVLALELDGSGARVESLLTPRILRRVYG